MSAGDHSKFAETMAGLLTVFAVIAVSLAVFIACALANDPRSEPLAPEELFDPRNIAYFTILFLMLLNLLQSSLYRLHPGWSIVFIVFFAARFAFDLVAMLHFREPLLIDLPQTLYSLLGLASSIIALAVRRGEWRKRRFRDAPCYWWDIVMVYTLVLLGTILFAILEIVFVPIVLACFAARHIYIVRALVRDARAFKKRNERRKNTSSSEAPSA